MKKKSFIIITVVAVIIGCTIFYNKISKSIINKSDLPKGELIRESSSKNGIYTIKIYRCNGGATVDFAVRGELIINDTNETKDIYWDYHVKNASVFWEDNDTVTINGKIINLPNGKYDWRYDENEGTQPSI